MLGSMIIDQHEGSCLQIFSVNLCNVFIERFHSATQFKEEHALSVFPLLTKKREIDIRVQNTAKLSSFTFMIRSDDCL